MKITVEARIAAPVEKIWNAYVSPEAITQWNAASDDWHTPTATLDLRPGGAFCYRMEARDGSIGFNFEGTFTGIVPNERIEYTFGDRTAQVEFCPGDSDVQVRVTFDPENEFPVEAQRHGWQSILNNFKRYVESH